MPVIKYVRYRTLFAIYRLLFNNVIWNLIVFHDLIKKGYEIWHEEELENKTQESSIYC